MEITKSLQDDIEKIQNELVTAIQNHQVLVLRQQVSPTDSIKTQIDEVQRHIICLGESQKILVTRLRNEIEPQRNNKHKTPPQRPLFNNKSAGGDRFNNRTKSDERLSNKLTNDDRLKCKPMSDDRLNNKPKPSDLSRSLLIKNANNRERDRSLLKTNTSDSEISDRKNFLPKDRPPSVDSSSEENRTPCESPVNGNSDNEQRGVKRPLKEPPQCSLSKRPKSTLQATPRPSSPVPVSTKALDALSSSSEESLDSLISQQPLDSDSKVEFALALGLITKDVYNKVIKKKSERRRRRVVSNQHHLYNDLWDLTVLQKRSRLKDDHDDTEDTNGDCAVYDDVLCIVCRKSGEMKKCKFCTNHFHPPCAITGHLKSVPYSLCPCCMVDLISHTPSNVISDANRHRKRIGGQGRQNS